MEKLKRDKKSKAIINMDDASYLKHQYETQQYRNFLNTEKQINSLKNDINEIKTILKSLTNGQ